MSNSNIHNSHIIHPVFDIHKSLINTELIYDDRIKNCSKTFSRMNGIGFDKIVPHQCHLTKICPICKISQFKIYHDQDLRDYRLLRNSFDNPEVLFLTLTLRTQENNNLQQVIRVLNKCFNQLCQSYIWRRMKKENKWMYVTKVLEIKTSSNKFHPHLHLHLGFKNKTMTNEEMRRSLRTEWIKQTKKFNVTSDHGVHLRNIHHESELNYIRKIDHEREVNDQTSSDFFMENESDQMRRLRERIKSEDITHPEDQKTSRTQKDPSYSIGELEKLHHSYLTDDNFKHPHMSHESVQGQLRQIYGYLGKKKTVTTNRSYSPEFKDLKKENKHENIQILP